MTMYVCERVIVKCFQAILKYYTIFSCVYNITIPCHIGTSAAAVNNFSFYTPNSAVFTTEEGMTCVTQLCPLEMEFEELFQPLPANICEKVRLWSSWMSIACNLELGCKAG